MRVGKIYYNNKKANGKVIALRHLQTPRVVLQI